MNDDFARRHLAETARIAAALDPDAIERLVAALVRVRARGGRLFFLGVGGGAANASHAVNDFRKLAGFEAYAPTDNVAELTARTNDGGWDGVFEAWLEESRLRPEDGVFVFSVGGGSIDACISLNLVNAVRYARVVGATIVGVLGRDGGFTATVADACVVVPSVNRDAVTPHTEAFQAVVWHLLVTHPALQTAPAKWESTQACAMNGLTRVKLFADGANLHEMVAQRANPLIRGFTTNPTLMYKAGVRDYCQFARAVLAAIPDRPIAFEAFADDARELECQARKIAGWGENVYVKIPITNAMGEPSNELIRRLSHDDIKVNVTAVLTLDQVKTAIGALHGGAPASISIFAGRIADTGRDPVPFIRDALELTACVPSVELIWASPREALNVWQADAIGCHIITVTSDILDKLRLAGKDLERFSLETVKMFRDDAVRAGYTLETQRQPT